MRPRRLRTFFALLSTAAVLTCAVRLALAEPGVVFTQGQIFTGELTQNTDTVEILTPQGVRLVIDRPAIDRIDLGTWQESFTRRLAALDPQDIDGRLKLNREALTLREYDAAMQAVQEAIEIDPQHERANQLLDQTFAQMRLEARADNLPAGPTTQPSSTTRPAPLPAADVNAIRLQELRLGDRIRVKFNDQVRQTYVDQFAPQRMSYTQFRRLPLEVQVLAIRDYAPQLLDKVEVLSDPSSLQDFRQKVLPTILSGCATSACHSGGETKWRLAPTRTLQNDYANFQVVMDWRGEHPQPAGTFAGEASRVLVDRGHPDRSLLLQFALPSASTRTPHPSVPRYSAILNGRNDARGAAMTRWIAESIAPLPSTMPSQDDVRQGSETEK